MPKGYLSLVYLACLPLALTACSNRPKVSEANSAGTSRLQRTPTSLFYRVGGLESGAAQRCHSAGAMVGDLRGSSVGVPVVLEQKTSVLYK
jgi:hypothetical protein